MGNDKPYRVIDHTADIGVAVTGHTPEALFENCAGALFDQLTDTTAVAADRTVAVSVAAPDRETLLVTFLNELLHVGEEGGLVLKTCTINRLTDTQVTAEVAGEKFKPGKHERLAEIKTTTYHQLKIRQQKGRWVTTVIFDV